MAGAVTRERTGESMTADAGDRLEPGTAVEVRNRFDGRWAKGFEVTRVEQAGYQVRRLSDGRELPSVFAYDDVRPHRERKRGNWWY
jgi:hypothetical protein